MFDEAQASIRDQLAAITGGRRAARLRELQRTVTALTVQLEGAARTWIEQRLPFVYELGAGDAASVLGESFAWTLPHVEALQTLAARSWDDLLSATRFVARDAKAWIRDQARQELTLSLIEGRTARQAAAALANAAGSEIGLFTVVYKDGSRHTIADYADSAVRAVSADTYNTGTINLSRDAGVRFMECIDGTDCGMNGHDDTEKPNGRVYPIEVAAGSTLSHPRCRRSWTPRIDATSTDTPSLRPTAQRADQTRSELAQSARVPRSTRRPRAAI